MDTIVSFILVSWELFLVISVLLIIVGAPLLESKERLALILSKTGFISFFVIPIVALGALIYAGISVPNPQADIIVSPTAGTFCENEEIGLTVEIRNNGSAPITCLSISFPFGESVVFDYNNASFKLAIENRESIIAMLSSRFDYATEVFIQPGDIWQISVPTQLTHYGNLEYQIPVSLCTGEYCNETKIVNTIKSVELISWVVLKCSP